MGIPDFTGGKKGEDQVHSQSKISRTLTAAVAALLMSSVAVGAAVGPAQAVASPVSAAVTQVALNV